MRAIKPSRGAWSCVATGRIRVLEAYQSPPSHHITPRPGTFAGHDDKGNKQIMTGDRILCIPRVKPAGKNPMPAKNFLHGIQLVIGDTLAGDDSA